MKICWHLIVLLLFLVNVSAASSGEDVFSGCYSLNQDGEPWMKIEKTENIYLVSRRVKDGWNEGASMHPGSQQELAELFKKDSTRIRSSLIADEGPFALFYVQAGETYLGFKSRTDYITYILIRVGSAYKTDCID